MAQSENDAAIQHTDRYGAGAIFFWHVDLRIKKTENIASTAPQHKFFPSFPSHFPFNFEIINRLETVLFPPQKNLKIVAHISSLISGFSAQLPCC
jgi:hypothetical protein